MCCMALHRIMGENPVCSDKKVIFPKILDFDGLFVAYDKRF